MNIMLSSRRFGADLFSRIVTSCTLLFAFASPRLAQIAINPEIGAFIGGDPGHTVFRQASPVFGAINNVDGATIIVNHLTASLFLGCARLTRTRVRATGSA
jgi:hypothetical protein